MSKFEHTCNLLNFWTSVALALLVVTATVQMWSLMAFYHTQPLSVILLINLGFLFLFGTLCPVDEDEC